MAEDEQFRCSDNFILAEWKEVQAAQADMSQFAVLYERYYEAIFRYLYKRCQDEELAADLTSDTFLKAIKNLAAYTFKGLPFSSWLYRIAYTELAQYYRKNKKMRVVTIEDEGLGGIVEESEWQKQELSLEALKRVLNRLEPDELILIELRYFDKMPYKQIAEILAITENNAKVKTYRIIEKLKKYFDEDQRQRD